MSATSIFTPNAHPETVSCDGSMNAGPPDSLTWAQIIALAVAASTLTTEIDASIMMKSDSATDRWSELERAVALFDTSPLLNDAVILKVYLDLYGSAKLDENNITPDINVYGITTATDTDLAVGDFDGVGAVAFCDTPISYANWNITGWNRFELNSVGIAAVNKTGITRLSFRNANYDVAEIAPAWPGSGQLISALSFWTADKGAYYAPRLIVEYFTSAPPKELTVLEALRNIEMSAMGKVHVDSAGNLKYESRFSRTLQ